MLDCLVLGDSIAVGTQMIKKECVAYAKSGYTSREYNKEFVKDKKEFKSEIVIISLGTNDFKGIDTLEELRYVRKNVKASRVYWIEPPCNEYFCKKNVNAFVRQIAQENGDFLIGTKKLQKDNIHPSVAGYKEIAEQAK